MDDESSGSIEEEVLVIGTRTEFSWWKAWGPAE